METQERRKPSIASGLIVTVTPDNFIRAETDMYFSYVVKTGGIGKFFHDRQPAPIKIPTVIRPNRDPLYSAVVFDLDAGPATITLPNAGKRFRSMQVIDQNQYTVAVVYDAGRYLFTREKIGTRYMVAAIRTFIDPLQAGDIEQVHALQDATRTEQPGGPGKFEVPNWDQSSQKKVRDALLALAATLPDSKNMFGTKAQVDPVRFLIGAAMAWGGNPEKEVACLNLKPAKNDGRTIHKLSVKDVPVDGFWSISVYNEKGYFELNDRNAYSINNLSAKKDVDGSITIRFGGCDDNAPNCLPIMPGWSYLVRFYRPRPEILTGIWKFPEAQPVIG